MTADRNTEQAGAEKPHAATESGDEKIVANDRPALEKLDASTVAALYLEHADELRRFLIGLLRHSELAADALQTTFTKAVEQGHTARQETLKSWLFTVAYHEAMLIRRRQGVTERAMEKRRVLETALDGHRQQAADNNLVRWETVERVRFALQELPIEQADVVRRRIFEGKKFIEIATELQLPLGTVLTRMHLALAKLRNRLGGDKIG